MLRRLVRGGGAGLFAVAGLVPLLGGLFVPVGHPGSVAADTTITIRTFGTALEFVPARIAVRQGTRVRLVYVNEGTLPHNLVVVRDVNDVDMLGMAAMEASETGYVPLQHRGRLIGYSELARPSDTVELEFEVPPPGEYPFVCLYSGHYNMMIGTLRSLGPAGQAEGGGLEE